MRSLLYLIGQPGAGKSTLAAALTAGIEAVEEDQPFARRYLVGDAHMVEGDESVPTVVELGARREKFSGTDALPMNVQPKVVEWLRKTDQEFVLGEGDRLANGKFFGEAVAAGWDVRIAYLAVPAGVAEERRAVRAAALGSGPQDPTWVRGRQTKVRRITEEWGHVLYRLNATRPVDDLVDALRGYGDPVVSTLDAARRQG